MVTCIHAALLVSSAYAQDTSDIRLSGAVSISTDFYDLHSHGHTLALPRRPTSVVRFAANTTLSVGTWLEVPIRIGFTSRETASMNLTANPATLGSILSSPINQFSIAPKFGPVQIHLGSIRPRYTSLIIDNVQLFGVGLDANPGSLRVGVFHGILNQAAHVDTLTAKQGTYARSLTALRLGSESSQGQTFGFTLARMNDDDRSIPFITESVDVSVPIVDGNGVVVYDTTISLTQRNELLPIPQSGAAFGFDLKMPITTNAFVSLELAGVGFTRNKEAPKLKEGIPVLDLFIQPTTATRLDVAGKARAGYNGSDWGLEGEVSYSGPGYVCLSQPLFQPDHLDVTLSPRFTLYTNRINGMATIGWRQTGTLDLLSSGSSQMLIMINANSMVLPNLFVNASYSNYGYRTTQATDSLQYSQISQSFNFSPSYTLLHKSMYHQVSASFGYDAFTNTISSLETSDKNSTVMMSASYNVSPQKGLWRGLITFSNVINNLSTSGISSRRVTIGGSYKVFDEKLLSDVSIIYASNTIGGLPPDKQITLKVGATSRIMQSLTAVARFQQTIVTASTPQGRAFTESLGTFSLTYSY